MLKQKPNFECIMNQLITLHHPSLLHLFLLNCTLAKDMHFGSSIYDESVNDIFISLSLSLSPPMNFLLQRFYLVGRDKSRARWRVLKIDRTEPSMLSIYEDPAIYTQQDCDDLLRRLAEGNRSCGGVNFVTKAYGIVGMCANFFC